MFLLLFLCVNAVTAVAESAPIGGPESKAFAPFEETVTIKAVMRRAKMGISRRTTGGATY